MRQVIHINDKEKRDNMSFKKSNTISVNML